MPSVVPFSNGDFAIIYISSSSNSTYYNKYNSSGYLISGNNLLSSAPTSSYMIVPVGNGLASFLNTSGSTCIVYTDNNGVQGTAYCNSTLGYNYPRIEALSTGNIVVMTGNMSSASIFQGTSTLTMSFLSQNQSLDYNERIIARLSGGKFAYLTSSLSIYYVYCFNDTGVLTNKIAIGTLGSIRTYWMINLRDDILLLCYSNGSKIEIREINPITGVFLLNASWQTSSAPICYMCCEKFK